LQRRYRAAGSRPTFTPTCDNRQRGATAPAVVVGALHTTWDAEEDSSQRSSVHPVAQWVDTVRYKVPLIDVSGRTVLVTAHGIKHIMTSLDKGDLAPMRAAFP
jgi:hypothetical protein